MVPRDTGVSLGTHKHYPRPCHFFPSGGHDHHQYTFRHLQRAGQAELA